jgi:hypothetical protein
MAVFLAITSATVTLAAQAPSFASNTPPASGASAQAQPVALIPSPRLAPPEVSPWHEFAARPFTLEARYGVGTPIGFIGVAGELSPVPALAFGCGAGTNLVGLQLACWLSGRIVLRSRERAFGVEWARAITLSSGFSEGRYVQANVFGNLTAVDGPGTASRDYARAYWWNSDIGLEERHKGLVLRLSLGVALLLNPSAGVLDQSSRDARVEPISHTLFYLAGGLGFAP